MNNPLPEARQAQTERLIRKYIVAVGRHWFFLAIGAIGGILGLVAQAGIAIPTWLWASALVGGIEVAQIRAFVDVAREAERATDSVGVQYYVSVTDLRIAFNSFIRFTDPNTETDYVQFALEIVIGNAARMPLEYRVLGLELELGDSSTEFATIVANSGGIVLPDRSDSYFVRSLRAEAKQPVVVRVAPTIVYGRPATAARFRFAEDLELELTWSDTNHYWSYLRRGQPKHERIN